MSLFHEDITLSYKFNFFTMWSSNNNNSNIIEEKNNYLKLSAHTTTLIQLNYINNMK